MCVEEPESEDKRKAVGRNQERGKFSGVMGKGKESDSTDALVDMPPTHH